MTREHGLGAEHTPRVAPGKPRQYPTKARTCDRRLRAPLTPTGESAAIQSVRELIAKYARSDAPVLITGETGTGKEIVARALHDASPRAGFPFIAVNCAAITEGLFESELFGSTRGAYTGATRDRKGLVGLARGGTLFLDEIGEIPGRSQSKLLRFVEDNRYRPVGGSRERRAEARIVAATNQSLTQQSNTSGFRRDLYYRLAVLKIDLPPLRKRADDIPLLLAELLDELQHGGKRYRVAPEAIQALRQWPWPGNVRELKHTVERALLSTSDDWIRDFPLDTPSEGTTCSPPPRPTDPLSELLTRHRGQLGPVAEELRVSVRTVQRRMKELALNRLDFRDAS
ncbi:sigma-54 dependent transcriptional regulator [Myxococcota bacterium]|nr:sigma-54 dependent transcriptional regulator [Myxococcota bacterium]